MMTLTVRHYGGMVVELRDGLEVVLDEETDRYWFLKDSKVVGWAVASSVESIEETV